MSPCAGRSAFWRATYTACASRIPDTATKAWAEADISKAQHCRAEVWLTGYGWVPVDPADVRKVVLEEKPGLTLKDAVVADIRARLFGAWEMNWMPYSVAHDVELPGS